MHYIELVASLTALLILGLIAILTIAMIRVSPTDIPAVVNEAGAIVCRLAELLLRTSPSGSGSTIDTIPDPAGHAQEGPKNEESGEK